MGESDEERSITDTKKGRGVYFIFAPSAIYGKKGGRYCRGWTMHEFNILIVAKKISDVPS